MDRRRREQLDEGREDYENVPMHGEDRRKRVTLSPKDLRYVAEGGGGEERR